MYQQQCSEVYPLMGQEKYSYLHWSAYDHKLGFKTYIETRNLTDVR